MDNTVTNTFHYLFGNLDIEGEGSYFCFLKQQRTQKVWVLTTTDFFDANSNEEKSERTVAILSAKNTGRLEGWGKTYLLTRLMTNISSMVYLAVNNDKVNYSFSMEGEYHVPDSNDYIKFKTSSAGNSYLSLELVSEGFRLSIDEYNGKLPLRIPTLTPVVDRVSKAALVTNLGIQTAASLFRSMGERLDWYKSKKYRLIDNVESFQSMMSDFLDAVQRASEKGKSVLVGLDTETTGLHMLDLDPSNPLRDNVVCIPFAWKDNESYLICTDMFYFSNVPSEKVYPLLTILFRRNKDFTMQDIELDYGGKHYSFNRKNITVSGWNVMFDEMAFFTEGADVFFDEDGRQIYFNLNTDLQQGLEGFKEWGTFQISNSLKMQTRRMLGTETLELEELMGKGNEDKFRYLQDEVLAKLYGCADADFTRLVVKKGLSMTEPRLHAQYRKYDMTIMYMMAQAAWSGMPIDTESVINQGNLVKQDLETLKDFIYHYAWLANRETLQDKMDSVMDLLNLNDTLEVEEAISKDKKFCYPFTPANHKKLLFQMLGYPVIKKSVKSSEPALDKFVLEKLMVPKREHPVEVLKEDIMSSVDPTEKLIDKDKFNEDAYPLARVFSTYATLNKEYTSYYKPIVDNDTEGRMFYDFTLARAATRRILSPGQTMKGSLKKLVKAPKGQIFMSFDASQIEYRHMASLAYIREKSILKQTHPEDWEQRLEMTAISKTHALMQKEEADYHIETAAMMTGVRQHEVTPKIRKKYKSIGFGIPYGLGERSMCESIFKVVTPETLAETRQLLADYNIKQREIIELLETTRDSAFVPAVISEDHRKYLGIGDSHVGIVRNFIGFYRVFILENLTRQRKGRIRRQAGNCIIQGGAAELFRRMLYNFRVGCCKAGIEDKVHWLMTVHDELDATVDADIDILKLIKVLYENCTLRYEDHIPYYIGINFGANWDDAKADANELPVIMVQRMIDAYDRGVFSIPSDGYQAEYLLQLKRHYLCDRIYEELLKILPNLKPGYNFTDSDIELIDDKFVNYVVRSYLEVFSYKGVSLKEGLPAWLKAKEDYGFNTTFLDMKFDSQEDAVELPFFSTDDLNIDLLDDTTFEDAWIEDGSSQWFNETSLFDTEMPNSEILVTSNGDDFLVEESNKEVDVVENNNPTNAFDVFVTTKRMRTKVLKVQENMYTVLLYGTEYQNKVFELAKELKRKYNSGSVTLILIGSITSKVEGISLLEEDLANLDLMLEG